MHFSQNDLQELNADVSQVSSKREALQAAFTLRKYRSPLAEEYGVHGFCRRVHSLARCILNVFEAIPPDQEDVPSEGTRKDVELFIQAALFNVFGCLDNLAWVWVSEREITQDAGTPIPRLQVGLGPNSKIVRRSLSIELQKQLDTYADWFQHIEDFRHALAHRIPPYVPPYIVSDEDAELYQQLDQQRHEALQNGKLKEYEELTRDFETFGTFRPIFTHSFGEKAPLIFFHPQLIADFKTIESIAEQLLMDLES